MKPTITPSSNSGKSRLQLMHQYYIHTGFYNFIWKAVKSAFPYIVAAILALVTINQFFDINAFLVSLTEVLPVYGVLSFFFMSETILGLVPPEMFIAWSGKMATPWFFLTVLAFLSYAGGLMAYVLGKLSTKNAAVHRYLEQKMEKQLEHSKKWGGFLIVIGALLPLPFAISCMAAGLIKYPFSRVLYYGSLRIVRIFGYGIVIFNVL